MINWFVFWAIYFVCGAILTILARAKIAQTAFDIGRLVPFNIAVLSLLSIILWPLYIFGFLVSVGNRVLA